MEYIYLYLLSPLHTGGTTQEGNLLGIARESHTNLPYIPSSTVRGKVRSLATNEDLKHQLFGNELKDGQQLEQGNIWIGDASILWLPVPSLSHSVVWVSCPLLLQRWQRLQGGKLSIPSEYSCNFNNGAAVYLKDAIIKAEQLQSGNSLEQFVPQSDSTKSINRLLVLPDKHCATLIQMSLWRQVKIKLDAHKSVDGGFRYEEAIPPDTLMYLPWGITSQANGTSQKSYDNFKNLLAANEILQIGGQESLGRGFVQQWM
ncbi:type III-B CRISPR module RAMP protein Cmr4 [Anabaena cylindrica FACHB-243]|uniref:CRISPR-associated protein, Cmr4 family n=1 Tax=Anabaena cylindrica (strain ATCC 27899 / PCC 7122) TaxID=272123 RepID=K9ZQ08_ANACC|nr:MULTISPECIES: type III-B CRISPR module RAMP protein Cmr4 [Anabaena]AFZ61246.1 CRISPR-associated protein, Cmr4 family [Anabaena cylindrica PCC 7122]MBD2416682.1 type III-B CRISPR module RAMP protein Cmr4 [Anabaena cylindrica FACHB-243]MBY5284457.1 type III-B CRISPR module RAMP protein Cmr4 [Anabaena sp. CCAP 1446/1C]MBY5311446.1 type III-B CRISPR module RAMP protein Cmr4 [Anabaena sp. CCAP 1446/1C]MCM2408685.1 type III-B CRISPR module RAMP protein Cmr4 [Anabaena sp. CCAP 1446/1C]